MSTFCKETLKPCPYILIARKSFLYSIVLFVSVSIGKYVKLNTPTTVAFKTKDVTIVHYWYGELRTSIASTKQTIDYATARLS
jgi:hypothetical protein